jgi:hypothetical protein
VAALEHVQPAGHARVARLSLASLEFRVGGVGDV